MRVSTSTEIRDDLRRRISAGEYRPGDRLPRLQELMSTYDTRSRSALDRALRDLVAEGLLTVVHGSGIYVRRRHAVRRDLVAGLRMEYDRAVHGEVVGNGLFEAMTGAEADVQWIYEQAEASERVARLLEIQPAEPVLVRTFRYVVDGTPHQIARSYLPSKTAAKAGLVGPQSEIKGLGTIAHLHANGITVDRAQLILETRMPTAEESDELQVPRGTPLYEHWRVLFRGCEPVEVSTAIVPGDRVAYVFDVDLTGDQR